MIVHKEGVFVGVLWSVTSCSHREKILHSLWMFYGMPHIPATFGQLPRENISNINAHRYNQLQNCKIVRQTSQTEVLLKLVTSCRA